jgi:hypothetical protein
MALRIKRPYKGKLLIHDNGKTLALDSKDGYSPRKIVKYVPEPTEENPSARKRIEEIAPGKPFEVDDEAHVLSRHGAICERA